MGRYYLFTKKNQTNEIRDDHHSIKCIRKVPDESKRRYRSDRNAEKPHNFNDYGTFRTKQIIRTSLYIGESTTQAGKVEENSRTEADPAAYISQHLLKSLHSKCSSIIFSILPQATHYNEMSSNCTDNNSIEKYLHRSPYSLLDKMVYLRS